MDDKELSLLVAKDLGGITPKEVEDELELGEPMGFAEVLTAVGLLVRLAQVAIQFWTKRTAKTTEQQLVEALEAAAASAFKIDEQMREEIIQRIVDRLTGSKVTRSAKPAVMSRS